MAEVANKFPTHVGLWKQQVALTEDYDSMTKVMKKAMKAAKNSHELAVYSILMYEVRSPESTETKKHKITTFM